MRSQHTRLQRVKPSATSISSIVGNSPQNLDESPTGLGNVVLILMQSPGNLGIVPKTRQSLVQDSRKVSWTSETLVNDEFSEQYRDSREIASK